MKDLDFDELDRAVSSILGAEASTASQTSVAPPPEPPVPETTAEEASTPEPAVVAPAKPLVEKRSSGRFMDVMHTSSDMKKPQKPVVSRQAATIAPPNEPTPPPAAIEPTPSSVAPEHDVNEEVVQDDTPHSFPDPLDFHNFSVDESPHVVDTTTDIAKDDDHAQILAQVTSELSELDGLIAEDEAPVSVETPFVNGSAIEKRPLGAFSVDTASTDPSLLSVESPAEPVVPAEDVSPSLQDPVQSDEAVVSEQTPLVTEEPDTTHDEAHDDVVTEREAQIPIDAEIVPEELKGDIVAVEAVEVTSNDAAPSSHMGAGSIVQQYVEKVQPDASEPTPVFDTTHYHQPLKHAPQQKSGWLGVVLIIVFVLAGIGGGAAVYFFDPFGLF